MIAMSVVAVQSMDIRGNHLIVGIVRDDFVVKFCSRGHHIRYGLELLQSLTALLHRPFSSNVQSP
jgi:hypothetical protein